MRREKLPSYNARANEFEKALFMTGAYKIYSGGRACGTVRSHPELAPVYRRSPPLGEEPRPHSGLGCGPGRCLAAPPCRLFRAITLLGKNARMVDLAYSMRKIGQMTRRLGLPKEWVY